MCGLCIAMPQGARRISAVMRFGGRWEGMPVRHVPVIPVRMTEAWLLIDEPAIRRAAGNPNGRNPLDLPALKDLEALPDPKEVLHDALAAASGLNVRRRARFSPHERARLVSGYMTDYAPLDALPAFRSLQNDILAAVRAGLE